MSMRTTKILVNHSYASERKVAAQLGAVPLFVRRARPCFISPERKRSREGRREDVVRKAGDMSSVGQLKSEN
jgi:hypothetical protein